MERVAWISPGNDLVPVRKQAFIRAHDDIDLARDIWSPNDLTSWKVDENCVGQKVVEYEMKNGWILQ